MLPAALPTVGAREKHPRIARAGIDQQRELASNVRSQFIPPVWADHAPTQIGADPETTSPCRKAQHCLKKPHAANLTTAADAVGAAALAVRSPAAASLRLRCDLESIALVKDGTAEEAAP